MVNQKLHSKGSTCCGNSDSNLASIISPSHVAIFMHINRILTELCQWKLEVPVVMEHHV